MSYQGRRLPSASPAQPQAPIRRPRAPAQTHNWSGIDYPSLTLNQSCTTSWTFNHQCKSTTTELLKTPTRRPPGVAEKSGTKTLQSSLPPRCLQLDSTIYKIHGFNYIARSSPRFKHRNAPISMRAVVNSGGYHGMANPTIKRHDLGKYKEIITCKSCSYPDSKYLHPW